MPVFETEGAGRDHLSVPGDAGRLRPPGRGLRAVGRSPSIEESIDAVVQRHQGRLQCYLRHLGCDRDAASDLAQDAFVVLLSARSMPAPEKQFAFLRVTARNLWRNWLRQQRRQPRSAGWAEAVDKLWAEERRPDRRLERLSRCLERLSPRSRQGVEMSYAQGMSRAAVGAQLKMSVDGIKSMLQRARRALSQCMNTEQEGGER